MCERAPPGLAARSSFYRRLRVRECRRCSFPLRKRKHEKGDICEIRSLMDLFAWRPNKHQYASGDRQFARDLGFHPRAPGQACVEQDRNGARDHQRARFHRSKSCRSIPDREAEKSSPGNCQASVKLAQPDMISIEALFVPHRRPLVAAVARPLAKKLIHMSKGGIMVREAPADQPEAEGKGTPVAAKASR